MVVEPPSAATRPPRLTASLEARRIYTYLTASLQGARRSTISRQPTPRRRLHCKRHSRSTSPILWDCRIPMIRIAARARLLSATRSTLSSAEAAPHPPWPRSPPLTISSAAAERRSLHRRRRRHQLCRRRVATRGPPLCSTRRTRILPLGLAPAKAERRRRVQQARAGSARAAPSILLSLAA